MIVESAKGECNLGQHEIDVPLRRRAGHVRQPHDLQDRRQGDRRAGGHGLTFMAKFNEREGNSCHIHFSLRDAEGAAVIAGDGDARVVAGRWSTSSPGQLACHA